MSGLVLDLQQEVLNANCDILNVLRKAHVIAKKLSLDEFDSWINSELNGYKDYESIPEYRTVTGIIRAWNPLRGWIPFLMNNDELEHLLCTRKLDYSIGEIIELDNKAEGTVYINFSAEINSLLNEASATGVSFQHTLHISQHLLKAIIEKVKNTILEWTIKLDGEGIIGEGMRFNSAEKESAKRIPQTINNYYGNTNVINAEVNQSAIIAGDKASAVFTYEKAKAAVSEIETELNKEVLESEDRETAKEIISEVKEKIEKKKKQSIIRSALIGLKDFLIGVGASATVAIIQAKMQGLF